MKCNCIKEMEEHVKEVLKSQEEYKDKDIRVDIPIETMIYEEKLKGWEYRIAIPVNIEYDYVTKTGKARTKKEDSSILAEYCPFCGKRIRDMEEIENENNK